MSETRTESSWVEIKLGDIGAFSTSSVDKKRVLGEVRVRLINYMDVYNRNTIDASINFMEVTASTAEIAKSSVERGDVIFTPSSETPDDIGHSAVVLENLPDILHSYHTVRFRLSNQECLDHEFRAWFANGNSVRKQFERKCAGSTRYTLSLPAFRSVVVTFPISRHIQRKIAHILQTIDRAIEKTEALIDKYQQIKAGLMHDLFTRGIGPGGQLRPPREQAPELYQETRMGWIPKDWRYELLDSLALRGSGHTPSKSFPEYWNGGVKWLSLADSPRLDRLYIHDTDFEISEEGIKNSSAVLHPPGVVVLSRDAGIGKSAISTISMAVSQHFMCWRCGAALDNHFLYYWLQFNKRTFENIAMGSTILTIGLQYFKRLKISYPGEVREQRSISSALKAVDDQMFTLEKDLLKKREQKSGLMHDLLTGKVRVQVEESQAEPAPANA